MPVLVDAYDAFAIDLDGVVWRGLEPILGASDGIEAIRNAGKPLVFLTNNALLPPEAVAERLQSIAIEVQPKEVVTSAGAARAWIRENGLEGASALVLGDRSVEEQFADLLNIRPVAASEEIALVLIARDTRFTFDRLQVASAAVTKGAHLVAVNRDPRMPVQGGFEPGTGALVAAIEVASGGAAVVVGKPELPMMKEAEKRLGRDKVLVVGDQPSSDVLGARRMGWDAAIVLSGVSAATDQLDPAPDYVLASLSSITEDATPIPQRAAAGASDGTAESKPLRR